MKFAFFFPGQGSQSVGMMQGLADSPDIRQTFDEASDLLGQDFWSMVTEPNEALNQTTNTQPLMLTAGVATWRAWQAQSSLAPTLMAGHSLGEYTALVAAGDDQRLLYAGERLGNRGDDEALPLALEIGGAEFS